jgi:hypothetical protein
VSKAQTSEISDSIPNLSIVSLKINDFETKKFISFDKVYYNDEIPLYSVVLKNVYAVSVQIIVQEYEEVSGEQLQLLQKQADKFKADINSTIKIEPGFSAKKAITTLTFSPIINDNGVLMWAKKFTINYNSVKKNYSSNNNKSFGTNSVLASGDWYKLGIVESKVYKLTYNYLKNLGIDVDNIDPRNIKIYGNGGEELPKLNSAPRKDDLYQNSIFVAGESDGVFNKNDYVLFYGQGTTVWKYNNSSIRYEHYINQYSDTSYYFLTVNANTDTPKRIPSQISSSNPTVSTSEFDDYAYYEKDYYNLIRSGSKWFGDIFDAKVSYDYTFNFPNLVTISPLKLRIRAAARSGTNSSMTINIANNSYTMTFPVMNVTCYYCQYAGESIFVQNFLSNSSLINLNLTYNKPNSDSKAWLDYIELNARRQLIMTGNQMGFRDYSTVAAGNITQFNISGVNQNGLNIWEVTDVLNPKNQQYTISGTTVSFAVSTDSLREFVAFYKGDSLGIYSFGKIENQNLHSITQADFIIVAPKKFNNEAQELADFHTTLDNLNTIIVEPSKIYNEFSSGKRDIVAIRDFVRMLYKRATPGNEPKYLLLFGDGSYDNKNRFTSNTNVIPTFQSSESFSPTSSYVSDDYYCLLDDNEGVWNGTEYLDIGVGRFPVNTVEEAKAIVSKIKHYKSAETMKDWRNKVTFIGDDEDGNTHMQQADQLAYVVDTGFTVYNIDKIYFDAYPQIATPGGQRYPDVNEAIGREFEKGTLIMNYTGHGGEIGWAHERVLGISDINGYTNFDNLPVLMTATCEFARFDDPKRTSAGELVLLNPDGGGIGLFTTVRLVYSSPNKELNDVFWRNILKMKPNGEMPTMGDVFKEMKIARAADNNARNFTLLADPALKLNYPQKNVITTAINGKPLTNADTLKALSKITITGFVADENGNKINNFNGYLYPTVFDKKKTISTLNNDGNGVFNFQVQNAKLFKGKVSVTNGEFSFTFIVPKDINYAYGNGKLSFYAENGQIDAHGYTQDVIIGGTSDSIANDTQGPTIDLYMNDETFIDGGMTDENPLMLAKVYDEHGINMVGNGIGHDIVAILDNNTAEPIILNDYFEAELNSYQRGKIQYPFKELQEGKHTLTIKVWDVYNNSAEETIEFNVVKSKDVVIDHVLNYPNPFTTHTEFWFEHNQPGQPIFVQVQIFTVTGKVVRTLEKNIVPSGFRFTDLSWDGKDDFGDNVAAGTYIYKLTVRASNLSVAEKYEKLVKLK